MPTSQFYRRFWRGFTGLSLMALGLVLILGSSINLRLIWVQRQVQQPEAIVVLGGDFEREYFAARFAQEHPQLPLVISSGMPEPMSRAYFDQAGIQGDRLIYDHQAVDTFTNFTTLLPTLQAVQIRSVYVITSDFHRARSRLIAYLVWGSHGIVYQFVIVPTQTPAEPWWLMLGDGLRAVVWLVTGRVLVG
ncbi:MAG: YdcF family protein [Spirulinaceae cyanobacterium]